MHEDERVRVFRERVKVAEWREQMDRRVKRKREMDMITGQESERRIN